MILTADTPGGFFDGDNVTDDGNGMTGSVLIDACGIYSVTYTLNSSNGCSNVNTMLLETDRTPPLIDPLPMDMTVECDGLGNDAELEAWLIAHGNAMATDNCTPEVDLVWDYDLVSVEDSCGITLISLYRFTVTDECGNSSMAEATFTIEDTTPPQLTPDSDGMSVTYECDDNNANNDDEFLSWLNNNAGLIADDVCNNFVWSNDYNVNNWVEDCAYSRYIDVTFTATDECGNSDSWTFRFGTEDTTPPTFENCPRPDIVENAEAEHCDAYINFSAPYATDNCSEVTINNLSPINPETGEPYESGDRYPVGTTIMTFEAVDDCMNADTCIFKIIVNDYWDVPTIECPESITTTNDAWLCGKTVVNIAPETEDNCPDNVITTYQVAFEGEVLETGLEDASGFFFPVGTSTVTYCVQDQPLLLISEVTQDADNICGGDVALVDPSLGDDYIELTNFGPASYDVSCLVIERTFNGQTETYVVPQGSILAPGDVLVLHYGPDEDVPVVPADGCILLHMEDGTN